MIHVSFYTLGCKLNQCETEALSDAFRNAGFTVVPPDFTESRGADLYIINTCTVTSKAEQKARRMIRLCLRKGGAVLVTGCYAQLEGKALTTLSGKGLFVFPGRTKDKLLDLPQYLLERIDGSPDTLSAALAQWCQAPGIAGTAGAGGVTGAVCSDPFRFNPQHFLFHSRPFLKIQDGCDRRCAYCRVPLARGKSISLSSNEVLRRLQALEEAGMAEAVLTGVNISQYSDPVGPTDPAGSVGSDRGLPALLRFLLDNTRRIALRLSSLEPELFVDDLGGRADDFCEILAHERIRNHFHLSVQSGSDAVLAAMGRPYRARDVLRGAEKLRAVRDDPFLACDIIIGFPGETEEDFEKTVLLCRAVDFVGIHAFPYSKRPGTPAAVIKKGLVSQEAAGKRLGVLLEAARRGRDAYVRRWQGKVVDAVAESWHAVAAFGFSGTDGQSDFFPFFPALTDNYMRVLVSSGRSREKPGSPFAKAGSALRCRIGMEETALPDGFDAWALLENGKNENRRD